MSTKNASRNQGAGQGEIDLSQQLRQLREHMPNVDTRVAAIFRRDRPITPRGDTIIEADDEVFFIAAKANIRAVMSEMRRLDESYKRIVIAGGGQIGERLAEAIESRYQVKIIEMNPARCRYLSDTLDSTVVLQGSASDRDLMLEENIADADVFLALTNDDEANIMSSLLAKRLGAKKVMTIINNPAYVDLIQGGDIDIAISPQLATIGTLLAHVRRGDIVSVHSLRRGAAEAIEAVGRTAQGQGPEAGHGVSVWLDCDLETLWHRVRQRPTRPLLQTADPRGTLERLLNERGPVYALADIRVAARRGDSIEETANRAIEAIHSHDPAILETI